MRQVLTKEGINNMTVSLKQQLNFPLSISFKKEVGNSTLDNVVLNMLCLGTKKEKDGDGCSWSIYDDRFRNTSDYRFAQLGMTLG